MRGKFHKAGWYFVGTLAPDSKVLIFFGRLHFRADLIESDFFKFAIYFTRVGKASEIAFERLLNPSSKRTENVVRKCAEILLFM